MKVPLISISEALNVSVVIEVECTLLLESVYVQEYVSPVETFFFAAVIEVVQAPKVPVIVATPALAAQFYKVYLEEAYKS